MSRIELHPRRITRRLALILLWLASLAWSGCGHRPAEGPDNLAADQPSSGPEYGYRIEDNQRVGQPAVILTRSAAGEELEAGIVPAVGANLFSLVYRGHELLYLPDTISGFDGTRYGVPLMYPTPCRVPQGKFGFQGRRFEFGTNRGDTWIHGLVRTLPWESSDPQVDADGVSLECWIDFSPGDEHYRKFNYDHRLTVTYRLDQRGLEISWRVTSRDSLPLPYGFGLHPYFNYPDGEREGVFLKASAESCLEMVEQIPTGKLQAVAADPERNLGEFRSVAGLRLDDVFAGLSPDSPSVIEFRRQGVRLTLEPSPELARLIVYALPENPFFCVENLTSAPDAHNLYDHGLQEAAHLMVAPPGGESGGAVLYRLEGL